MQLVTVWPGCTGTRALGTKGQYTAWAVGSSVIASRDYGDTSPSMCGTAIKVALVDDDESVRRALGRLLRMTGMQVDLNASGREFLAAITDDRPDCVILDMYMPEMTGMEVQVALAWRCPDLPIVFITAHDNPVVVQDVLAAGAETVLRKPFSEQELISAIHAAVAARTAQALPHE
jgi:FixJ family two-component response regulator